MLRPLLLIGLTLEIAWCNLLVSPQNTAVVAGQMMGLECRAQNGWLVREWTLLRTSSVTAAERKKIFTNWNSGTNSTHLAQFSVDVDEYGSGTLYSNSTKLEDAGLYACVVELRHELSTSSAQLIVLESAPMCETNLSTRSGTWLMEGNRIWMRCRVGFRGHWTPSMEWKHHGEGKDGRIIAADEVVENDNFNVASTITIVLDSSTNNSRFSCKTFFANEKNRRLANATNTPDFIYIWTSPEIKQIDSAFTVVSPMPMIPSPQYHTSTVLVGLLVATSICLMITIFFIWRFRKNERSSGEQKGSIHRSGDIPKEDCPVARMAFNAAGKQKGSIHSTRSFPQEDCPVYAVARKPSKPADSTSCSTGCVVAICLTILVLILTFIFLLLLKKERSKNLQLHVSKKFTEEEELERSSMANERKKERIGLRLPTEETQMINRSNIIDEPISIRTLKPEATLRGNAICVLAIIGNELFVLIMEYQEIEVFDVKKLEFSRKFSLKDHTLKTPWDMVASSEFECLYVVDERKPQEEFTDIIKIDPLGNVQKTWPAKCKVCRLSITPKFNVIVTSLYSKSICEYSADGGWIREITFAPDTGIVHPWVTLKKNFNEYIISFGSRGDAQHRVCAIDRNVVLED